MPLIEPVTPLPLEPEVLPTSDVPIVKRVVYWMGLAQAVLAALAASTAFMGLHPVIPGTVATLMLVLGAVQVYLEKSIQRQVTANSDVVEARVGDSVYAGPANMLATPGARVRSLDGRSHVA